MGKVSEFEIIFRTTDREKVVACLNIDDAAPDIDETRGCATCLVYYELNIGDREADALVGEELTFVIRYNYEHTTHSTMVAAMNGVSLVDERLVDGSIYLVPYCHYQSLSQQISSGKNFDRLVHFIKGSLEYPGSDLTETDIADIAAIRMGDKSCIEKMYRCTIEEVM